MRLRSGEYIGTMYKIFPEEFKGKKIKEVTFQVTEDCNLRCSYCYQTNKSHKKMTFSTAKKLIDLIFQSRYDENSMWYQGKTEAIVFDFIGGEPFLEIDLINQIVEYIEDKLLLLEDCPWTIYHMYSFSSNGTLYFTPKVQEFIKEYRPFLSIGITVDGNKELHDLCRVFPDGSGSYDTAIAASLTENSTIGNVSTKLTFSPDNISYVADGVINLLSLGLDTIFGNPVFEEGWELEHAKIYYLELKKIVDYLILNNITDRAYISMLDPEKCKPYNNDNLDKNYCGVSKEGTMVAMDYEGNLYPCVRFMPSSLGKNCKPLIIGNYNYGIDYDCENFKNLINISTKNMSNEECLNCPIATGCAWCTAYCYQCYGNFDKRTTFHCLMHVAEALAAKYLEIKTNGKSNLVIPYDKGIKILPSEDFYLLQ